MESCKNNLASCFCELNKDHKGIHKCRCDGSWDDNGNSFSFPDLSLGFDSFPLTEEEQTILLKK